MGYFHSIVKVLVFIASCEAVVSCSNATDCSLLGDCINAVCECIPGWTGQSCTELDLLPAPRNAGLRQKNSSNWCGTIHPDTSGLWHMWSSDMHGCGLNIWLSGSQIIHAVASSPIGPYSPIGVAVHAEAHNPQLVRAPDGSFLLMDSYGGPDAGCPGTCNYSTCTGGPACGSKGPGLGTYTFHASNSTDGEGHVALC